jgi:hypothetical protein
MPREIPTVEIVPTWEGWMSEYGGITWAVRLKISHSSLLDGQVLSEPMYMHGDAEDDDESGGAISALEAFAEGLGKLMRVVQ